MGLLVNSSTKLPIQALLFFLGERGVGGGGGASMMTASASGSCMGSVCTSTSPNGTALDGRSLCQQTNGVTHVT